MSNAVIIRPILTEKMTALAEKNCYAFEVSKGANKIEIRQAIEAKYPEVRVAEIRTMIVRAKRKRQLTRQGPVDGKNASYKKAIVALDPAGPQIDFYENV
jgi:large subunit ribosomal protein L23